MNAFRNITRPKLKNKGGLTRLLIADVKDVVNTEIRVVRGTGYVNEPIILKENKNWIEVDFTPKSLKMQESTNKQFNSSLFPLEITWRQAKDEPWKLDQFRRMEKTRWIALVQNNNEEWMIVGTPTEPAVFSWTNRSPGERASSFNGYSLSLMISRNSPIPFYKVFALFYWNSNGELVFDNTFDSTLNAELSATGDLSITGPNSNLYTEVNGNLIYTG